MGFWDFRVVLASHVSKHVRPDCGSSMPVAHCTSPRGQEAACVSLPVSDLFLLHRKLLKHEKTVAHRGEQTEMNLSGKWGFPKESQSCTPGEQGVVESGQARESRLTNLEHK
uniref:Uncharacterized protein n=1 Tax=Mus spicilegus TaxID=10103 RepID=A0A8C6N062_MUSSI